MSAAKGGPGVSLGVVNAAKHLSHLQSRIIGADGTDLSDLPVLTLGIHVHLFWFSPSLQRGGIRGDFPSMYRLNQNS